MCLFPHLSISFPPPVNKKCRVFFFCFFLSKRGGLSVSLYLCSIPLCSRGYWFETKGGAGRPPVSKASRCYSAGAGKTSSRGNDLWPHCMWGAGLPSCRCSRNKSRWFPNCCWEDKARRTLSYLSGHCRRWFGWEALEPTPCWVPSAAPDPGAAVCRAPGKEGALPRLIEKWWAADRSHAAYKGRLAGICWNGPSARRMELLACPSVSVCRPAARNKRRERCDLSGI